MANRKLYNVAMRRWSFQASVRVDVVQGRSKVADRYLQLSNLQRRILPLRLRRSQTSHHLLLTPHKQPFNHHHPNSRARLPPRRLSPRPFLLDPPALHNRHLPHRPLPTITIRNYLFPQHIRETLSLLGLRRGFPDVDAEKHAAGE